MGSKVFRNLRIFTKTFVEESVFGFCQKTVLPGFRYIGDRSLSLWERLFFLLSFGLVLTFVSLVMADICKNWGNTPVIVGISPYPVLINKLPFPTVTICNVNQVRASKVKNLSRGSVEYSMLQMLCYRPVESVNISALPDIESRSDFQSFISETAQPCESLLISCKFGATVRKCKDIFKPVLTDEGQCCAFNALHSSFIFKQPGKFEGLFRTDDKVAVNWDVEDGYQKRLPRSFFPERATGTGISKGLEIVINAEVDDYYCSSTNGPGFKLLLHNPTEIPTLRENGLYIKVGTEMNFRIAADRSEASQNIRGFSISDRQCVFKSERQLGYFKTYTRRNCELECIANMTAKLCGCVNYFLPKTWTNLRACGLKDQECRLPILVWTPESAEKTGAKSCQEMCTQGCFDLSFSPARFNIPLTSGGYMIQNPVLERFNTTYLHQNIAVIHFYYKMSHFDAFTRTRYAGTTEFLSNTGGVIGLLGFSFISVAEILYYFLLRPLKRLGKIFKKLWTTVGKLF